MIDLVLGGLKLLRGLLVDLALVLLLLVELVDELILMGDLVVEVPDLMVLRRLVLLGLLQVQLEVLDVLLQTGHFLLEFLLVLEEVVPRVLLFLESVGEVLAGEKYHQVRAD